MKELKTFQSIVTKAAGNTIEGLWTVYGVVDSYGDRAHAGLWRGATPSSVRFMWNHDLEAVPVARITKLLEVGRADLPAAVRSRYPEATSQEGVRRMGRYSRDSKCMWLYSQENLPEKHIERFEQLRSALLSMSAA